MIKSIVLITGTEQTRKALLEQIKEYIGDLIEIKSYALDEGINEKIRADLVVLSTRLIYDEVIDRIDKTCPIITARRTINYSNLDKLLFIEKGTEVLFVNDVKETTEESIDFLKKIGINHIKYNPYYPGIGDYKKLPIAVTPGEVDKVPNFVNKVIDIGPRLLDMTTITEILSRLNMLDKKAQDISMKYLEKIIELGKKFVESTREAGNLSKYLESVIEGINDGILAFDPAGRVTVMNENLKDILQVKGKATGRNINEIIRDDELLSFLYKGNDSNSELFKCSNIEIMVNRFKLKNNSIIATFKKAKDTIEMEKRLRRDLIKKGYIGKYTFNDIIGCSNEINKTKEIAKKLAKADFSILIEGESGTGKELFASAIHNYSQRKDGPFLAVNFSALPDDLVESELFGYEEGAFTGAKKGGKVGLFEQADGGTIFLDEIGDVSLKVQTRLLRVLQEKEIMRIGGNKIIPVDVRVISATNKDLTRMIVEGRFREDLYHRLRVLYLKIPPLRNRKTDIVHLIKYFLAEEKLEDIEIHNEVIDVLLEYDWPGNVRELKNILNYMIAVCENNTIKPENIPTDILVKNAGDDCWEKPLKSMEFIDKDDEIKFLLQGIYALSKKGEIVGRKKLMDLCRKNSINLTENQVRYRLNLLENNGYIVKSRGRVGTRLTQKGLRVLFDLFRTPGCDERLHI
jgi:transcriptional regulator with PAS, ATPase and Fis domain